MILFPFCREANKLLKNKIFSLLVLLVSLVAILTSTVNFTFGFIVTKTSSLTNTFVPDIINSDDITVSVRVNKTVKNTGVSSISPAGFEFVLENTASGEKLALKSDENGNAIFTLPFTEADAGKTYTYKLYETNDGMSGVTYDTKVYHISIAITSNNDNKLVSAITLDGKSVNDVIARFENTYYTDHTISPPTADNNDIIFWLIVMISTASIVLVLLEKRYEHSQFITKEEMIERNDE